MRRAAAESVHHPAACILGLHARSPSQPLSSRAALRLTAPHRIPLHSRTDALRTPRAGILDVFGAQRLQLGGPVHMETLTLLHGFSGLAGGQKVSEVC